MNYSDSPNKVRVDFWKESGKWYDTVELNWDNYGSKDFKKGDELVHDIFKRCLIEQYPDNYRGLRATCLEPYHVNSHPISLIHRGLY